MLTGLRNTLFNFVLSFFERVNRTIRSRLPISRMEEETSEHVRMLTKVFKFVVLPISLFYVCSDLFFLKDNVLGSMFWGIMIFIYSNFLPDLPAIYRRKENDRRTQDLSWYKKYTLLLLAPLFIWLLISGTRIGWKTSETFHNFRSLAIYGTFLLLCGFFAFGEFPISIGAMTEILSLPLYGLAGYLTHLKVDKIW